MPGDEGQFRVGISGSYGGLNLGDEAILQGIITQLRRSVPVDITVFTRDIADTSKRYSVERVVEARSLTRAEAIEHVKDLDLFILGGGGILFDAEAKSYLREVQLAQELGIPVMVYAVSAGPLKSYEIQHLVRDVLSKATIITVRERHAKKILEDTGIGCEIAVTADPAFLLEPEPVPCELMMQDRLTADGRFMAMSVREPGGAAPQLGEMAYHELLANAADFMIDRFDADIVFVPMEHKVLDMQHSHAVIAKMLRPQRAWVLRGRYTPGQLLSVMDHFEFAVGMRLHFLIFAALRSVPFVALPYATKVEGILEELQIEMPPLHLVNAGRLISYIDRYWDARKAMQENIKRVLPAIRERAMENNRIAVRILKGEYIAEVCHTGGR
jgi:polysaccharide pyruvyl transferase CsaB